MRARDVYELRRQPAPDKGRWWRRLGQVLAAVLTMGEPVTGGGAKTLIVETATGQVIGDLRQRFGDEFYATRLEEDLLTLSVEDFRDKLLSDSP